jgi:hypothetical protein
MREQNPPSAFPSGSLSPVCNIIAAPDPRVEAPGKAGLHNTMSYMITPFEVSSKALGKPVHCRFVHLLSGIATRHSDTIDSVFLLDGKRVLVGISCAGLSELHERDRKSLSDQQLAEIAALFLRRTLEHGDDPRQSELFLPGEQVRTFGRELGFL